MYAIRSYYAWKISGFIPVKTRWSSHRIRSSRGVPALENTWSGELYNRRKDGTLYWDDVKSYNFV